jgi:putative hydrolase of the HAD superfamily
MMLRAMLARERVPASRAVLVEDNLANLAAARALGFRTVLMTGHGTRAATGPGCPQRRRAARAGLVIRSLHQLPHGLARLRR